MIYHRHRHRHRRHHPTPRRLGCSPRPLIFAIGLLLLLAVLPACATLAGRPPRGGEEEISTEQRAAIARLRQKVEGLVVWSSSRFGNHDLFLMKTDGSGVTPLTSGDQVDWYPRFSPDGQRVLFTRSKRGWVSEAESNRADKWDLYLIDAKGGSAALAVSNASWGTWTGPSTILFSRGTKVLTADLETKRETELVDSAKVPDLDGAELQNPHLSPDGRYLTLTLRGAKRETGILSLTDQRWVKTGEGCQVNWFPSGDRIFWVNPSGNGGSEILSLPVRDGRPTRELTYPETRFMDLPGRRSHEYFPELDRGGKWLVWAATQRGHDHDIADYDIYLWEVGTPPGEAARLTFHSGNDRWPDIFIPAH